MIKYVAEREELKKVAEVIRCSFRTIADDLDITFDTCPSHPAYITDEQVFHLVANGVDFYAMVHNNTIAGVVGVQPLSDDNYSIEKLAVLPEYRHFGFGRALVIFSLGCIYQRGGRSVSIAIVDDNKALKQWYAGLGFVQTGIKQYSHLPFTVCYMQKSLTDCCLTQLL